MNPKSRFAAMQRARDTAKAQQPVETAAGEAAEAAAPQTPRNPRLAAMARSLMARRQ